VFLLIKLLFQLALFLLWAPLVNGIVKKTKARLQRRVGPPVWQTYYDLRKYFRKQMVISQSATWIFHAAPVVHMAAVIGAALLAPAVLAPAGWLTGAAVPGFGDMVLLAGLLALGRFVLALAALESGSAFGGMGSSREMAVSCFIEPALLLTLGVFTLRAGTTGLAGMAAGLEKLGWASVVPGHLLAMVALLIIAVAETGRVPVDNPDTHLELTMIHEGMVLEYSGPYLAMIVWSHDMKQLIMLSLLADLALPFWVTGPLWLTIPVYLGKTLVLGVLMAFIETAMAKVRILKIPDLLTTAAALAILAAISDLRIGG
jgi:formate hydrogenlyase subunit 4